MPYLVKGGSPSEVEALEVVRARSKHYMVDMVFKGLVSPIAFFSAICQLFSLSKRWAGWSFSSLMEGDPEALVCVDGLLFSKTHVITSLVYPSGTLYGRRLSVVKYINDGRVHLLQRLPARPYNLVVSLIRL